MQSSNCEMCAQFTDEPACLSCGLVQRDYMDISEYSFQKPIESKRANSFNKYDKISNFNQYTSKEKGDYKLKIHIKNTCDYINSNDKPSIYIPEHFIEYIQSISCVIMDYIKQYGNSGSKRSKVKDGIILIVIYNVLKMNNIFCSYNDLCNENIEPKYISTAHKNLIEIINILKKSKTGNMLPEEFVSSILLPNTPIDYILQKKNSLNFNDKLWYKLINDTNDEIKNLQDCEELLNNNPLTFGVICFYICLNKNKVNITTKELSNVFGISNVILNKSLVKIKFKTLNSTF